MEQALRIMSEHLQLRTCLRDRLEVAEDGRVDLGVVVPGVREGKVDGLVAIERLNV